MKFDLEKFVPGEKYALAVVSAMALFAMLYMMNMTTRVIETVVATVK